MVDHDTSANKLTENQRDRHNRRANELVVCAIEWSVIATTRPDRFGRENAFTQ
jgi:hypothetical protein